MESKVSRLCKAAVRDDEGDLVLDLKSIKAALLKEVGDATTVAELRKALKQVVRMVFKVIKRRA